MIGDERNPSAEEPAGDAFAEALLAQEAAVPAESDLYSRLLGSWEVEVIDYLDVEAPVRSRGEVHFARVLEGRAVQDVWIAPPRSARAGAGKLRNRYGTTLRTYDPERDVWKVIWVNPISGVETRLVGRREGDRIVQLGRQADGRLYRWTFFDITASTFSWRGEDSADDGSTWRLGAEFFGRRLETVGGSS